MSRVFRGGNNASRRVAGDIGARPRLRVLRRGGSLRWLHGQGRAATLSGPRPRRLSGAARRGAGLPGGFSTRVVAFLVDALGSALVAGLFTAPDLPGQLGLVAFAVVTVLTLVALRADAGHAPAAACGWPTRGRVSGSPRGGPSSAPRCCACWSRPWSSTPTAAACTTGSPTPPSSGTERHRPPERTGDHDAVRDTRSYVRAPDPSGPPRHDTAVGSAPAAHLPLADRHLLAAGQRAAGHRHAGAAQRAHPPAEGVDLGRRTGCGAAS